MASNEDLYRQMEQEEEELQYRYRVPRKDAIPPKRKEVDVQAAMARHARDFQPVIDTIKRAQAGLPLTNNPFKNFFLKLTGRDKVPTPEVVEPTMEPVLVGKNEEERRLEIIENFEKNKHLRKAAVPVRPVAATRKTAQDLRGDR